MPKVLIDTSNIAYRAFHGSSKIAKDGLVTGLSTRKGIGTGMAFGSIQTLFYLFTKYRWSAKDVTLVWDGRPEMKYEIYPEYKASRKKASATHPEGMGISMQFKITRLMLGLLGIPFVRNMKEESDDVIATMAHQYGDQEVIIISGDHDMLQLLTPNVKIMSLNKSQGIPEEILTDTYFIRKYGIQPKDYIKVLCLAGCPTDDVPGMPGVAEKTALKIIKANPWKVLVHNDPCIEFPDKRTRTAFYKGHSKWNMVRDWNLVRLRENVQCDVQSNVFDEIKFRKWLIKLEMKHFLSPEVFSKLKKTFQG